MSHPIHITLTPLEAILIGVMLKELRDSISTGDEHAQELTELCNRLIPLLPSLDV